MDLERSVLKLQIHVESRTDTSHHLHREIAVMLLTAGGLVSRLSGHGRMAGVRHKQTQRLTSRCSLVSVYQDILALLV